MAARRGADPAAAGARACWSRSPCWWPASSSRRGSACCRGFGLAIGAGLLPASLSAADSAASLRRTPLAVWGMVLAHFGVAVAIIGMASDSAFTAEKLAAARPGETVAVGPWLVEFRDVMPVAGPNWTALEAELRASRGSGVTVLKPQSRFFRRAADDDQRGGNRYQLEWPALRRAWRAGRAGPLAAAPVVEAVRHPDLAGRGTDRAWAAHWRWLGRLFAERRSGIRGEEAFG